MPSRVYVCHTIYHAYIASLKELELIEKYENAQKKSVISQEKTSEIDRFEHADLVISTMSNDFGLFPERARNSGLWNEVYLFEEKEDIYFPEVMKYHSDKGNIVSNMINRIKYTKKLGLSQAPYVPVDFKKYDEVNVFCDSDPIGYYLNVMKIPYHAIEDGLDTVFYCDDALFSNRGHFGLKMKMAEWGLIHIPDGYAKYCIDMEVNNTSILNTPCKKYKEVPRRPLYERLTEKDKDLLVHMFVENVDELIVQLKDIGNNDTDITQEKKAEVHQENTDATPIVLILSDPLCDLDTRKRIFTDIVNDYGTVDGKRAIVIIKPHPRDVLDYKTLFPDQVVLPGRFPMEMLNLLPGVHFNRVVTVFTVPDAIDYADEKVFLGPDFMDKYEAPELHRQNEIVAGKL